MNQQTPLKLFVSCAKGLQYVLEKELIELGAAQTKASPGGVQCTASLETSYRILLWSRIASRVIVNLCHQKVSSADDIYELAKSIDWTKQFNAEHSFVVHFVGTNNFVRNSTFGALKIKDAVVDDFRERFGQRPSIDRDNAEIAIHAHLAKGWLSIGLDLSGESLHKRHYRFEKGAAPLRENLAAGILRLAGWPEKYESGAGLIDPMCGSGTFLIEAAQMALDLAPAIRRERWGFDHWLSHQPLVWERVREAAQQKHQDTKQALRFKIVGFDQDARVIAKAWKNVEQAGLQEYIHVEKRALDEFERFEGLKPGLLIVNPPYGERLGEINQLVTLYKQLGSVFDDYLQGWQAAVFTGNQELGKQIGWRSHKQYKLFNGAIESQLLLFKLEEKNRFKHEWKSQEQRLKEPSEWRVSNQARAEMFENRLKKNSKSLAKWLKKEQISCYRLYDADMPEYALAIDIYQDTEGSPWCHIQEYAAPKSIDEKAAFERLSEALAVVRDLRLAPESHLVLKSRMAQKGKSQYEKQDSLGEFKSVREGQARLWVNFKDYLDTGLFLDHRPVRRWLHEHAKNKRILNLFCYTAAVTVQAALGGAKESLSLDMSSTYLNWAQRNYDLNQLDPTQHRLERADCTRWLMENASESGFDIIFLDPPSFSNSKNMEGILDIQRDHESLIDKAMAKLARGGLLIFSNNLRKFKLADSLSEKYLVSDWNKRSLDRDFERNPNIHHCWGIQFKN